MADTLSLKELQSRFSITTALTFEEGPNGLVRAAIFTPHAEATIYLYGAHLTHYRPSGQKPLLFMSAKSNFEAGKPIRGGVPICFPWFGPRAGEPSSPIHGFVRILPWAVESANLEADKSVSIVLRLDSSDETLKIWPHSFTARYRVVVGQSLSLALEITNTGSAAFTMEEALHTYFSVADVREISIAGLAGVTYLDKTDAAKRKVQLEDIIRITAETDRPYLNTRATTVIDDPIGGRRITLEKANSDTTVVWNPWIAKAKAMADFGDEEWPVMLCIETANASENALTVQPNQIHAMQARVLSEPR